MDTSTVIDLGRQAVWMTILIASPLLAVGMLVGVVVGVLQAATSINEMTLSFIPKLVAMALGIGLFGHWQLGMLIDYGRKIFERIPGLFH